MVNLTKKKKKKLGRRQEALVLRCEYFVGNSERKKINGIKNIYENKIKFVMKKYYVRVSAALMWFRLRFIRGIFEYGYEIWL